uniref:Uncharacterized protein n=1 Tax=Globodera rostochiensis TaxID=31243 RepID=A0A914GUJ3_GLORO
MGEAGTPTSASVGASREIGSRFRTLDYSSPIRHWGSGRSGEDISTLDIDTGRFDTGLFDTGRFDTEF